jgi:L,D-peptidoglycan transpeptidase YkuD (ErfK/YbiS/YcfS/YnhG family)
MKRVITLLLAFSVFFLPGAVWATTGTGANAAPQPKSKWQKLLDKYRYDDKVREIMFVKYKGGSKAKFYMYKKTDDHKWKRQIKCKAYVGRNGICSPKKKGRDDYKTPTGNYKLLWGFGIKKNPGTSLKYIKVKDYHYLCGDKHYYNQLININKKPHDCQGEHLINFGKPYYYGANFDYNKKGKYKRDYAIFLHCFSGNPFTGGCISISQKNMIKALKLAEPGTRICIDYK